MRRLSPIALLLAVFALAACGGSDDGGPDARTDAARFDGPVDAPAIDAPFDASPANGVICESPGMWCTTTQACCITPGTDTCIAAGAMCAGTPIACDGPEDCAGGQDCCWFEGQHARCTSANQCGFTGAPSEPLCHLDVDCPPSFPHCGPPTGTSLPFFYSVCRPTPCPPQTAGR